MVPPLMETYAATLRAPSLTLQYGSGVGRIHTGEGSPSARQSAIHPRSSSYLFRSAGVARRSITERTKDCVYRTHDTVDTTSCETSPRHLGGEDSAARIPRQGVRAFSVHGCNGTDVGDRSDARDGKKRAQQRLHVRDRENSSAHSIGDTSTKSTME